MKRRDFISIAGVTAAWPLAARAQQPTRRIGVLMARAESDPEYQRRLQIFRDRLKDLGWVDGNTVRIDYRWTAGVVERFQSAAAELVALKPDVIVADATPSTEALRRETRTIPIVMVTVNDPIGSGFAQSLARPGGNITGFTNFEFSMGGKWLDLLKEIAPKVARVALMYNPSTAPFSRQYFPSFDAAAVNHGIPPALNMPVNEPAEIDRKVAAFAREPNGGLMILSDSFLVVHRDRIISSAAQHRLPAIYAGNALYVKSGGLIAYGIESAQEYRGAANYVDRILKGTSPVDLPVQGPTKFTLSINRKTATTLGLTVPNTLLVSADEVIE